MLLRKIKGLNKVRLVDAKFIWTEPHSRRIKMLLTVQREVLTGTVLQQSFEVETVMAGQQCPDCARTEAKNTWQSVCQVRQKVPHKRTFLYLEQVILKHGAHKDCVNIKGVPDGLDFFFSCKQHALKFQDFLSCVVPLRSKSSEQLISQDTHTGSNSYKFTFSIELIPLCRDDLIILPQKLAQSLGNICQLVVCSKVTTSIHLIDPNTCQTAELSGPSYFASSCNQPIKSLFNQKQLNEYYVMDVESGHTRNGKFQLCDVTLARCLKTGELSAHAPIITRSHLGGVLKPGDYVLGYDLSSQNVVSDDFDEYLRRQGDLPDVILIRKSYHKTNRRRHRNWRLKSMDIDYGEDAESGKKDKNAVEEEYDRFLEELEEDKEMREQINMYRVPQTMDVDSESTTIGDDTPRVPIEELLDDMTLE
jgi:nonsense-mediated mRNA decay protein 3